MLIIRSSERSIWLKILIRMLVVLLMTFPIHRRTLKNMRYRAYSSKPMIVTKPKVNLDISQRWQDRNPGLKGSSSHLAQGNQVQWGEEQVLELAMAVSDRTRMIWPLKVRTQAWDTRKIRNAMTSSLIHTMINHKASWLHSDHISQALKDHQKSTRK